MKLKRVSFTSTSWDKPRNIPALGGNQNAIYVGQVVNHTARAESAKVESLNYDGSTSQLYMRLVHNGGPNDGKPFRRMTMNPQMQEGEECDVLGMFCDDRTLFYYDDEAPAATPGVQQLAPDAKPEQTLPQCSACGKDSQGKPLCPECHEKSKATKGNQPRGK